MATILLTMEESSLHVDAFASVEQYSQAISSVDPFLPRHILPSHSDTLPDPPPLIFISLSWLILILNIRPSAREIGSLSLCSAVMALGFIHPGECSAYFHHITILGRQNLI